MLRKERGSGLASIEDGVNAPIQGLKDKIKKSSKNIAAASNSIDYQNSKTEMGRKTTVWILQVTNSRDYARKDLNMLKKGKPQERNRIFFLIAAKNHVIRIYYIKAGHWANE